MKTIGRSGAVVIAFLIAPAIALGVSKTCLTGTDPAVAGDLDQITAVRAAIASACPCASFDGSKGKTHATYLKCAKGVIATAVSASNLRTQCKGTVTTDSSLSTCGQPAAKNMGTCITTTAKGKVKCAIKPVTKCTGASCPDFTACIDAADTNADGLIGAGDSGACAVAATPTGPPSNSTPTATATPQTGPSNTPPPPMATNTPTPTNTSTPTNTPTPTSTPTSTPTNTQAPTQFTASLNGTQAGTASTATGSCTGTLNAAHTSFSIMCTHNVVSPTAAHIHSGAPGVSGPIVFPFSSPASPINATWSTITPSDVATLLAGNDYVNIHSGNCGACPGGEIRGQLLVAP